MDRRGSAEGGAPGAEGNETFSLRFRVIALAPRGAGDSGVPQLIPARSESTEVAVEGDPHGEIALNEAPCADDFVGRRGQAPP